MEQLFATASLWLALALLSALIAARLRLSIALVEICVGVGMAACSGWFNGGEALALNAEWVRFLASAGAVVLTFLAGGGTGPGRDPTEIGRSHCRGNGGISRPLSRMHRHRIPWAWVELAGECVVWRGLVDNIDGRGLCGDAGHRAE